MDTCTRNQQLEELHDALVEEVKEITRIVFEVKVYQRGIVVLPSDNARHLGENTVMRVRTNDGKWRDAKSGCTHDKMFAWLRRNSFEMEREPLGEAHVFTGTTFRRHFWHKGRCQVVIPVQDQNPCSGTELR